MAREKQLQCSPVTCTRRSWTLQWSAASSGRAWSGDAYAMVVKINCLSLAPRDGRIQRQCPLPAPAPGPSAPEPPRAASNGGASRRIHVEPGVASVGRVESRRLARCCPTRGAAFLPTVPDSPPLHPPRLARRRCSTCLSSVATTPVLHHRPLPLPRRRAPTPPLLCYRAPPRPDVAPPRSYVAPHAASRPANARPRPPPRAAARLSLLARRSSWPHAAPPELHQGREERERERERKEEKRRKK
jgi:hypothetical protein